MTGLLPPMDRQVAIPGILGGLGPMAHVQFEQRLIQRNVEQGARGDRDHPVWVLINGTTVPDRTQSLQGTGPDCTSELVRYAQLLERAGANFLVVTCNTAHGVYDAVQAQLGIPWIHLMACTSSHIRQAYPAVQRVGVLATDGTLQCGLYERSLSQVGLTPMGFGLDSPWQKQVMDAIYHPNWGIKTTGTQVSTKALTVLEQATGWLKTQGAEVVIAGCTELSVAFAQMPSLPLPWVDPLEVVADITLDLAWGVRSMPLWQAA
ncbi:aspartate/glutamate racemase family protein [Nodosilinea sp. PGN35]|uniref:aspartate/glutamate racemase family protein n=1 Tax=Nodosilinea sp. PGN35 TaxID=3020489 RepID=UPI0023B22EA6|nr:amino acid racemase [Nodosilinea sp. TSF1-S3]MDF0367791.1 amino acid racemase [Nodosilinea sp. TSF1-S3]